MSNRNRMPTQLPLDALEMALWVRDRGGEDATGVIQHSDAGAQYTAIRYAERLIDVGVIASIGTVGDSYDCEHHWCRCCCGLTLVTTGPAGALALTCRPQRQRRPDRLAERAVT